MIFFDLRLFEMSTPASVMQPVMMDTMISVGIPVSPPHQVEPPLCVDDLKH